MSRGERLDRWLAHRSELSRQDVRLAVKNGWVQVNGELATRVEQRILPDDEVLLDDVRIANTASRYLMVNKPAGYLCANEDSEHPLVVDLLADEVNAQALQMVGRLDLDATGLVLLTDDGQWNHRVTAPARHCEKTYRVKLAQPLDEVAMVALQQGVLLRGENKPTRPAHILRTEDPRVIFLTISEGRYHQVKRMLSAVGNHVEALHRERIGTIVLDPALAPGEYRALTLDEVANV